MSANLAMETRNCSLPAPVVYSNIMHYTHIISFPIFLGTLIILFREKSKLFQTYKYFIIVHVIMQVVIILTIVIFEFRNIATESYMSFFMLPMTYLPHPLFRTTGWMAQWGFSGLMQFFIIAQLTQFTVGSILEMFYYRLKVTIVHHNVHFFPRIAKFQLNVYRFCIVFHPLITTITFPPSVIIQGETTMKEWLKDPTFPPEITCYSVIIAVFDNWVFWIVILIYCIEVIVSVTGSVGPLIFIIKTMKKGFTLSPSTMKLQKILIISLFIQGGIHSVFIITPTFFQIYAMFFELHENEFAQMLLLMLAYHGFLSTCAMIIFTKPLRDKFFFCFRVTNRTSQEEDIQSSNRISSNVAV